ncbi:hypothetical protein MASR2M66_30120 [Chloroflexota bacterium]
MSDLPDVEMLKAILEGGLQLKSLDTHPWVKRRFVLDVVANHPDLRTRSPGQQLLFAIEELFPRMMPSTTPRRGKRLDTHWGEFGILAAQYFAPLAFGTPQPATLRDAWGRIDESILLFVYKKSTDLPSQTEKGAYRLVGDELEVTPNSTLSDWHRNGLRRLAEIIEAHETHLSKPSSELPIDLMVGQGENSRNMLIARKRDTKPRATRRKRFIFSLLGLTLSVFLLIIGLKAWRIYNQAMLVREDITQIQELITSQSPRLERLKRFDPAFSTLKQNFERLTDEVEPLLWLGPWLKWVPVYGGDLASARDLMKIAESLLSSVDTAYQAIHPLLDANKLSSLTPTQLTEILILVKPQLTDSLQALDQAATARDRLELERLSPKIRNLISNEVDPILGLMQDGLIIGTEFPRLMGATGEGPKTYLLLVQNEDELRPTGGFITAAGTALLLGGEIRNLSFENSGELDNWSMPYPAAPWQLSQYMNSRVLVFRDANWFTDYPTAALYAEYLYSYHNSHSVDGVIAFDQQMLVEILKVIGPIELEGVSNSIDSSNVISYMRSAKTPTMEDLASPEWNNKIFINKISDAIIKKLFSGDVQWEQLAAFLPRILNERHLTMQVDNSSVSALLARHGWDGAVLPGQDDFLLVVDTNVGFNKTNAVVETNLIYDIDLTRSAFPTSSLVVVHKNNASGVVSCEHWNKVRLQGEENYPIADCYWNYLRVYTAEGTKLLDATPQSIPADWMILDQSPPAIVDILEEEIDRVQSFGTMQVVPVGQSLSVSFDFSLPANIVKINPDSGQMAYRLKVRKQPGTLAIPITIRIHLPTHTIIDTVPNGAIVQDQNIQYQNDLRTDLEIEIVFHLP